MKKRMTLLGVALGAFALWAGEDALARRWVYVSTPMVAAQEVSHCSNVIVRAARQGMNGVLLSCGLDFMGMWAPERKRYFRAVKAVCDANKMEIVPNIWSLGYGALQNYGINLLEAMPVERIPFVVKGTNAVFDVARTVSQKLNVQEGWQRTAPYHRLIKRVDVKPHRRYRLTGFFKTQDLAGSDPLELIARNAKASSYYVNEKHNLTYGPTQDWTPFMLDFSSGESDAYYLYLGFMGGWQKGRLDARDLCLSEVPPENVIVREGAPCTLTHAETGKEYAFGKDYTVPKAKYPVFELRGECLTLGLPPGSQLREGDRLFLTCYQPAVVEGSQVSLCLSNPDLYARVLADSAAVIERELHPGVWHISCDEFRNGNHCAGCRARNLPMAEIFADAITRMYGIVQKVHPGAEVMMWSDMLDPGHNAQASYYNCRGSFEGAWRKIPREITICCWYDRKCESSLKFFSERGFRTFGAAYYDEKLPLDFSRRWRDALRKTPGATGIMYTTWRNDYSNLESFCELIRAK